MASPMDESTIKHDDEVYRPYIPEEFQAEVLGISPMTLLDKLYNAHNIIFYRLLEGFGQHLASTCQLDSEKIKELYEKLIPRYQTAIDVMLDKHFSTFQQYFLDSVLEIPLDVVPAHYKGLDMEITDEHLEKLDEELEQAKNAVIGQRAFQQWAIQEEKRLDEKMKIKKQYMQHFAEITALMEQYNATDLDAIMQKIKEQIDELTRRMNREVRAVYHPDDSEISPLGSTEFAQKYLISRPNAP